MQEKKKHPIQPLEIDDKGVLRFKSNKIVMLLLNDGKYDLNRLSLMCKTGELPKEDYEQLMQLIGYSHSGACDLSSMTNEVLDAAIVMYKEETTEKDARYKAMGQRIKELEENMREIGNVVVEMVGYDF